MESLKKKTVVSGWKPKTDESEQATPAEDVEFEGWIDPEEAIKKASGQIAGYTTVTHTVEEQKYSFGKEDADEIRQS